MLTLATERRIRILIADDHELVRRGLRGVLEAEPDIEVVGEASTGEQALATAEREQPDVLLLDLRMPGMGSSNVCRAVIARLPATRVVVLSTFDDDSDVREMMDAGASGYLLKDVAPEALTCSLRGVADGAVVMHPGIAQRFIAPASERRRTDPADRLSDRELEVLRLMSRGMKNRDIAHEMWISESTVKTHVGRILHKLGLRDRTQAVLHAIKKGLVAVESD